MIKKYNQFVKENKINELVIAFVVEITWAPVSPFSVDITSGVGPEILKNDEPDPADWTPGRLTPKYTAVAFV